jgi:hypothetical protein
MNLVQDSMFSKRTHIFFQWIALSVYLHIYGQLGNRFSFANDKLNLTRKAELEWNLFLSEFKIKSR